MQGAGFGSVLRLLGYRRLWWARTVSQSGDVLQFTTLALLVLRLTGSGVGLSGAVLAEIAPVLLLDPTVGTVVDRLPQVAVMVCADLVRLMLAAALAVWRHLVVYAAAFGLSAGSVFFNPAAGSLLPSVVAREQLVAANSGMWSAPVLSHVVLAPVAGVLAVTAGFGWAFAINAASFAVSALLLGGLRSGEARRPIVTSGLVTHSREAFTLLARDRLFRALAIAQGLAALSAGATSALLGLFGDPTAACHRIRIRPVARSDRGWCVRRTVPAAPHFGAGSAAAGGFAAFGLRALVDLVLATALPAALGALVLYGMGTSTGNVTFNSLIQSHVPEGLRGRVFSAFDLIWQAMRLASLLLGGVVADAFGIRSLYYLGAALVLLAALAGFAAGGTPDTASPF